MPQFVYFDLGNVLLTFDNQRACRQMSQVSQVPEGQLRDFFGAGDYQNRLEHGQITLEAIRQALSDETGQTIDPLAFELAYSDIFGVVPGIVPLVARLASANIRLGILSNTSAPHWKLVSDGRFAIVPEYFECTALSFEIGAMKPAPRIYQAAESLAGVRGEDIFFTDDRPENVEAALDAGWDAVLFESPQQLASDLHQRGLRFNY